MYSTYSTLGPSTTSYLKVNGRHRFQTSFQAGVERIEEWTSSSNSDGGEMVLLSRRWRSPENKNMGRLVSGGGVGVNDWEYEVGEANPLVNKDGYNANPSTVITPSSLNPKWVPKYSEKHFLYIVENVPWPLENYKVEYDEVSDSLVLRTMNKKFYKKWRIPRIVATSTLKHCIDHVSLQHVEDSTLIIKYAKPSEVLAFEEGEMEERRNAMKNFDISSKASASKSKGGETGECKQS